MELSAILCFLTPVWYVLCDILVWGGRIVISLQAVLTKFYFTVLYCIATVLSQTYHEEMLRSSPRRKLFNGYAKQLMRRYPNMKDEINARLHYLNSQWEALLKAISPSHGYQDEQTMLRGRLMTTYAQCHENGKMTVFQLWLWLDSDIVGSKTCICRVGSAPTMRDIIWDLQSFFMSRDRISQHQFGRHSVISQAMAT